MYGVNGSQPPMDGGLLDVFSRPDPSLITLYAFVLVASLAANTLLIFIVIKFQYMRRFWTYFSLNPDFVSATLVNLLCAPGSKALSGKLDQHSVSVCFVLATSYRCNIWILTLPV
ncbi:unnamed protein product [Leptosia nina]|uniref:G-protein coupled receptors family 1 profile domain-containing protein n=1 Tax=Leptosia nina TaxID=320188 RepID=A0AAV1JVI1_9NEOP